jgi:hypothetical protein
VGRARRTDLVGSDQADVNLSIDSDEQARAEVTVRVTANVSGAGQPAMKSQKGERRELVAPLPASSSGGPGLRCPIGCERVRAGYYVLAGALLDRRTSMLRLVGIRWTGKLGAVRCMVSWMPGREHSVDSHRLGV